MSLGRTITMLVSEEEAELVRNHRAGFRGKLWSPDDFIARAERTGRPEQYNFDDFPHALERMVENHDANVGINWEVVDLYLEDAFIETKREIIPVLVPVCCLNYLLGGCDDGELTEAEMLKVREFEQKYECFSPVYSTKENCDKHFSCYNDVSRIFLSCDVVTLRCFERIKND